MRDDERLTLGGNDRGLTGALYAPDLMLEHALRFVRDNADHPFFLYYATPVPHLALQVPDDSLAEYGEQHFGVARAQGRADRSMNAAEIARALGGRKAGAWWSCRCPTHDDRNPSLGVRDGDRSVIVRCFAGCDSRAVISVLRARGLWDGRDDYRPRGGPRPRREPDRGGSWSALRRPLDNLDLSS